MFEMENVVVVRFAEASKAYQALSVLKECDADGPHRAGVGGDRGAHGGGRAAHPGGRRQSASSAPRAAR